MFEGGRLSRVVLIFLFSAHFSSVRFAGASQRFSIAIFDTVHRGRELRLTRVCRFSFAGFGDLSACAVK